MTRRISTAEFAERRPDILETDYRRGERFIVERHGEPVATLAPWDGEPAVSWRSSSPAWPHCRDRMTSSPTTLRQSRQR